jgi:ABC-type sulfate/molybdate transport systems ATPase subunit
VAVMEDGRLVQRGPPSELAAAPASAFVADFTGAVVLTGTARAGADGLTHVALDGGGAVASTEPGDGPVAVSLFPWEVVIEPRGAPRTGSAQNHLDVEVISVTAVGNRVRVGLAAPQPLTAEISDASARRLDVTPGTRVVATWKAASTRLLER